MADTVSPAVRSRMMSGIRGKNTEPELTIRRGLHAMGFRFLLYPKKLPGKPDLALPKWKTAIFVNGCFWHGHNCDLFKWPKTRPDFWKKKITGNRERDAENILALEDIGWRVLTIWECAIRGKNRESLDRVLLRTGSWIRGRGKKLEIGSTGGRKNGKA